MALDWTVKASLIGGTALSTISLAVIYAVLVEDGLNETELGKLLMSATFVTDLGTAVALSAIFIEPNGWFPAFLVGSLALIFAMPRLAPWFFRRYGDRVIEPEIKLIFVCLFVLMWPADASIGHAVLPAFILGLAMSRHFAQHRTEQERIRVVAFAFLTPFFFIRGGLNVSLGAVFANIGILGVLFAAKMVPKLGLVFPLARRHIPRHATFATLLMSTGLTFGTISALFGLNAGIIDGTQFSLLITVVSLGADPDRDRPDPLPPDRRPGAASATRAGGGVRLDGVPSLHRPGPAAGAGRGALAHPWRAWDWRGEPAGRRDRGTFRRGDPCAGGSARLQLRRTRGQPRRDRPPRRRARGRGARGTAPRPLRGRHRGGGLSVHVAGEPLMEPGGIDVEVHTVAPVRVLQGHRPDERRKQAALRRLEELLHALTFVRHPSIEVDERLDLSFPVAAFVMTAPPYEWPTRTIGPEMLRRRSATYAASSVRCRSGFAAPMAVNPRSCRARITWSKPVASAHAPCTTRTTVGRLPLVRSVMPSLAILASCSGRDSVTRGAAPCHRTNMRSARTGAWVIARSVRGGVPRLAARLAPPRTP